ncbi:hypothetical protein HN748_00625 [Candidatus Peregrinibacteria bacterium]|jgi:hypothetical protein|nr:hypothetical protein [Candidatus Peregrinibacteria bacterium]MBT7483655.1 hypothetical protein [Candidatus Peregrinibacteria bacterium]MBT7702714.1 hypothetical protein [Candidatus Peregrinibacteria bacterium]
MTVEEPRSGEPLNEEAQAAYAAMKNFGDQDLFNITRAETNEDITNAAWLLIQERDARE